MLKKIIVAFLFFGCIGIAQGAQRTNVSDIVLVSSPTSIIGVSPSSWTLVDRATCCFSDATGMLIAHAPSNTQSVMFNFSTGTLAPASTFYGYVYRTTDPTLDLKVDKSVNVWFISVGLVQPLIKTEYR